MSNGSGNVSNIIKVGGANINNSDSQINVIENPLVLPEGSWGNYFTIKARVSLDTADLFWAFYKLGSNSIYKVTTGKRFAIISVFAQSLNSTGSADFQLGFDTTTFTDGSAVGSMTAPIYESGFTQHYIRHVSKAPADGQKSCSWNFPDVFPSDSYPFAQSSANSSTTGIYIIGKEIV